MKKILLIGANSAIAQATARLLAARGAQLFLIARDATKLDMVAADVAGRGGLLAGSAVADLNDFSRHGDLMELADTALDGFDAVLIAHGSLPDQVACQTDFPAALAELNVNFLSTVSLLTHISNRMESRGRGVIAVISSVAGDRGRQSNYIYGSAKAGLSAYLQGLRNRLHPTGIKVVTIKPGFVDTPMTRDIRKGALWATPESVARTIVKAMQRGSPIVYAPWFWRWIMLVVRLIPERIFVRLKL